MLDMKQVVQLMTVWRSISIQNFSRRASRLASFTVLDVFVQSDVIQLLIQIAQLLRSETYEYYKLPFCQPEPAIKYKVLTHVGEVIDANRDASTPFELPFRVDKDRTVLCTQKVGSKKAALFRKARLSCCKRLHSGHITASRHCWPGRMAPRLEFR